MQGAVQILVPPYSLGWASLICVAGIEELGVSVCLSISSTNMYLSCFLLSVSKLEMSNLEPSYCHQMTVPITHYLLISAARRVLSSMPGHFFLSLLQESS